MSESVSSALPSRRIDVSLPNRALLVPDLLPSVSILGLVDDVCNGVTPRLKHF